MGIFLGVRQNGPIDPSAGVTLMPRREYCPRCGVDKGMKSNARRGLCSDCSRPMTPADRALWNAA